MINLLRRVGALPALLPITALLLRAWTVRQSARFAFRELRGGGRAYIYDVRGSDARIVVRHGSGDAATVGEVFHENYYEPPVDFANTVDPALILDLGANIGLFCAFAQRRWPDARIEAYEPDVANAAILRLCAEANQASWLLHESAAADHDGEITFSSSGDALSHVSESGNVIVPCEDVLQLMSSADLVKIDIEGGEWPLLRDPRFKAAPPRAIVLEYHPATGVTDPRAEAIGLLESAGLRERHDIVDLPGGYGMLWAWRT